jgi:hypothetical protein
METDDLKARLADGVTYAYVPYSVRMTLSEAAEAIDALQAQLAEARAERDALVAVAGDAYYVLTYIEALSNDDATKAACAEVRTKIDAIKEQTP